jgi:hypothetical protein
MAGEASHSSATVPSFFAALQTRFFKGVSIGRALVGRTSRSAADLPVSLLRPTSDDEKPACPRFFRGVPMGLRPADDGERKRGDTPGLPPHCRRTDSAGVWLAGPATAPLQSPLFRCPPDPVFQQSGTLQGQLQAISQGSGSSSPTFRPLISSISLSIPRNALRSKPGGRTIG